MIWYANNAAHSPNSTVQYLYSTEIYPTRIRNVCYAFNMACHWFFQFAVVRVTPNMFASLDVWGAYVFWAIVCAAGLVVLWLWAPETKGVPMERMEELFAGRWYMGWKAKVDLSADRGDGGREDAATVSSSDASKTAVHADHAVRHSGEKSSRSDV